MLSRAYVITSSNWNTNDDETRRNVDVNDIVSEATDEVKLTGQPRVIACNKTQSAQSYSNKYN